MVERIELAYDSADDPLNALVYEVILRLEVIVYEADAYACTPGYVSNGDRTKACTLLNERCLCRRFAQRSSPTTSL